MGDVRGMEDYDFRRRLLPSVIRSTTIISAIDRLSLFGSRGTEKKVSQRSDMTNTASC